MRVWLSLLLSNLEEQHQAMVEDDLPKIMELIDKQHSILGSIEASRADALPFSPSEDLILRRIIDLVTSNQLLAQQSLRFARRVLSALTEASTYGVSPSVSPQLSGQALDKRV